MASITLSSSVAFDVLSRVVKDMAEKSPISQNEKKWARWRFVVDHFEGHDVTFDLDEMASILMRSKE